MNVGSFVAGEEHHGAADFLRGAGAPRRYPRDDRLAQDLDANRTAAAMLAGIQGGVVMMMSTGDVTPLEAALDLGIGYLRKNRSPAGG